jgi:zinc protease
MNNLLFIRIIIYVFLNSVICALSQSNIEYNSLKDKVPSDPSVKIGLLNNGMKYYIKKNSKPEKRAELYLVVDAGAVLEDDDQDGLAHFCEHMAFNGTKHFPKQDLINYLESIGIRFGADLNAFTSYEQTVYMLQQLPTDNSDQFHKGFQVLEDWASNILFDGVEIDKERGVVIEEWRLGKGAEDRVWKKHEKVIYQNSRYAERDVIGDTNILRNAPYDALKRFYRDWYRPNLMAFIAVGDFNVQEVETMIQEHFGKLRNPDGQRERTRYSIPFNNRLLASVATDKELSLPMVQIIFRHPEREMGDYEDYRKIVLAKLYTEMLNNRLNELMRIPNPPFTYFASSFEGHSLGKTREFGLLALGKGDGISQCLEALLTEAFRAKQHGFTATEFERTKQDILRNLEKAFDERDKTDSRTYAWEYMRNFLDNESMPGIEMELALHKKWLPEITLDEVNKLSDQFIKYENVVIAVSAPEKPDVIVPTEEEVIATFNNISKSSLSPYQDFVADKPLFNKKITAGKIIKEDKIEEIDVIEWTLSNGVKIVLKQTDFKNDEILFRAFSPGGTSLVSDDDFISATYSSSIINESGIASFNETQLEKMLAGKVVNIRTSINQLVESVSGNSSVKDMETMFQLINLHFTEPRMDYDAYNAFLTKIKAQIKNWQNDPESNLDDTVRVTNTQYHYRYLPLTEERLSKLDNEKAYSIYKERFADASDFAFFFVGSFKIDEIKPMILNYIGNLPTKNRKENWRDVGMKPPKGKIEKVVRKGIEPKSMVYLTINGDFKYTSENKYFLESMINVLNIRLREIIREDKGGSYAQSAWTRTEKFPQERYSISVWWGCSPERVDELTNDVLNLFIELKEKKTDPLNITKVKEIQKREYEVNLKENRQWLNWLYDSYYYGDDPKRIMKLNEMYEKLTAEDIQNAAKKYLNTDNLVKVVLYPEIQQ